MNDGCTIIYEINERFLPAKVAALTSEYAS